MPFANEFSKVFDAIKNATRKVGIECVRADEIMQPGPIINQIFEEIHSADVVIAEVSSKNPNVYYEIALAHCVKKPTILIADKDSISDLPFDIRHNRVLLYTKGSYADLESLLKKHLHHIKDYFVDNKKPPTVNEFLETLSQPFPSVKEILEEHTEESSENIINRLTDSFPNKVLRELVQDIGKQFNLTSAKLTETNLAEDGVLITVEDAFNEKVVALVDRNGIITRKKKIN